MWQGTSDEENFLLMQARQAYSFTEHIIHEKFSNDQLVPPTDIIVQPQEFKCVSAAILADLLLQCPHRNH